MLTSTQSANSALTYPQRFLRLPQVEELTGLKRSHIYNLMKSGEFPTSIKIGARAVAWISTDIQQWQAERISTTKIKH